MVAPLVSLGLALSRVNTLAQAGSSAVQGMSTIVSTIGDAFGKAFNFAINKAKEVFQTMRDVWNEYVKPIFQPLIDVFSFVFNTIKGIYEGVMSFFIDRWRAFSNIVSEFYDVVIAAFDFLLNPNFSNLITYWNELQDFFKTVWDETVGYIIEKISNVGIFDGLGRAWSIFADGLSRVYSLTIEPILDGLSSAVDYIFDKLTSIAGKIVDILGDVAGTAIDFGKGAVNTVGGFFGGGGDTTTTTASGGAVTNNFNITIDVGGVTDRTDKLALAREIASLIQTETTRAYGGSTSVTRY